MVFRGERRMLSSCIISAMTARKMLRKQCEGYLAYVVDTSEKEARLEEVFGCVPR